MTIQNLPQQRSDQLAQMIAALAPPKPIDIEIIGDERRYQKERAIFECNRTHLQLLKKESDELAQIVDESLHPEKRTLKAKKFQRIKPNFTKLRALQTILKNKVR